MDNRISVIHYNLIHGYCDPEEEHWNILDVLSQLGADLSVRAQARSSQYKAAAISIVESVLGTQTGRHYKVRDINTIVNKDGWVFGMLIKDKLTRSDSKQTGRHYQVRGINTMPIKMGTCSVWPTRMIYVKDTNMSPSALIKITDKRWEWKRHKPHLWGEFSECLTERDKSMLPSACKYVHSTVSIRIMLFLHIQHDGASLGNTGTNTSQSIMTSAWVVNKTSSMTTRGY
jgi:hypothetical protein